MLLSEITNYVFWSRLCWSTEDLDRLFCWGTESDVFRSRRICLRSNGQYRCQCCSSSSWSSSIVEIFLWNGPLKHFELNLDATDFLEPFLQCQKHLWAAPRTRYSEQTLTLCSVISECEMELMRGLWSLAGKCQGHGNTVRFYRENGGSFRSDRFLNAQLSQCDRSHDVTCLYILVASRSFVSFFSLSFCDVAAHTQPCVAWHRSTNSGTDVNGKRWFEWTSSPFSSLIDCLALRITSFGAQAMYGLSAAFMPLRPTDPQHLDLSMVRKPGLFLHVFLQFAHDVYIDHAFRAQRLWLCLVWLFWRNRA